MYPAATILPSGCTAMASPRVGSLPNNGRYRAVPGEGCVQAAIRVKARHGKTGDSHTHYHDPAIRLQGSVIGVAGVPKIDRHLTAGAKAWIQAAIRQVAHQGKVG